MKKINKAKAMKLIALIITKAILVIATIYMIPIIKQINTPEGQAEFKEKITNSGLTGMLILFGLELAQVVLAVLPGEPVELLAGICFGPIWGTIFLMISVFIVTAMIYFFVKKYGRDFIYEFFPKEKVNKLENKIILLGYLNQKDLREYTRKCRFLVIPSVWATPFTKRLYTFFSAS